MTKIQKRPKNSDFASKWPLSSPPPGQTPIYVCLVAWCNPMTALGPTPLRFPVWPGIPKPMIPYPLLWEGAVRTVGSHVGRIPNCSEVPDPPPPGAPPRTPPPSLPPPPPRGLRPTFSRGGSWRPDSRVPPPRGANGRCKGHCLNLTLSTICHLRNAKLPILHISVSKKTILAVALFPRFGQNCL